MTGRGRPLGSSSRWNTSTIPEKEVDAKLNEVVRDNIQDFRELSRKTNQSMDDIVRRFTEKLIDRLETGENR